MKNQPPFIVVCLSALSLAFLLGAKVGSALVRAEAIKCGAAEYVLKTNTSPEVVFIWRNPDWTRR